MQKAFNAAAIGMAFVGLDGRWTRVNASLCEMLGYSEQELCALTLQAMAPPEDLDGGRVTVHQLFRGVVDNYEREQRFYRKSGNPLWVFLQAWLVRDDTGHPKPRSVCLAPPDRGLLFLRERVKSENLRAW